MEKEQENENIDTIETRAKDGRGGKREGAGLPKGTVLEKTKEKRIALEEFRKRVRKNIDKLYNAQFGLATGLTYVYQVVETKNKKGDTKRENVLVTNSEEIKKVLDDLDGGDAGKVDEAYYFITTQKPDNKAIDSLMDRAFGKSQQNVDVTSGGKSMSVLLTEIEK